MSLAARVNFENYKTSVFTALDMIEAGDRLPEDRLIILKPNLTNSSPPPVTTGVEFTEAVYLYCRRHCSGEIAIGEGCGSGTTNKVYKNTGYTELASKYGIRLIDFNQEKTVLVKNGQALVLKEFHIPAVLQDAYVISLPILKDHSLADTTAALKNMFGIAPAPFYKGSWNKSKLHSPSVYKSVVDVCSYKKPDLSIVDAVTVLTGSHLSGTPRTENTILASFDPVSIDTLGAEILGHNPEEIEYLRLADGKLGDMRNIKTLHK